MPDSTHQQAGGRFDLQQRHDRGQAETILMIDMQIDLSWHRAQVIGEKMRNLINVCTVKLQQLGPVQATVQAVSLAAR